MSEATSAQAEFDVLLKEYEAYITELITRWSAKNRSSSRNVLEVMSRHERAEVDQIIARWGRYMVPLTETWWRERGYEVTWPDNDSEPILLHKLG